MQWRVPAARIQLGTWVPRKLEEQRELLEVRMVAERALWPELEVVQEPKELVSVG